MAADPGAVWAGKKVLELNKRVGYKRFTTISVGQAVGIKDLKDNKDYGQVTYPMLLVKLAAEDAEAKKKVDAVSSASAKFNKAKRQKSVSHADMELYEKPEMEDVMHYGVLGMKWGVIRSPEELGHKINKYEQKRNRAAKRLKNVESSKGTKSYAKYNKSAYKASKKLDKAENRLIELMGNNSELFKQSMTVLNGKQADIGRKWLTFSSATEEERFWMKMAERMKAS